MQKETIETKFESYFLPFSAQIDEQTIISQSGLLSKTIAINSELAISFQDDILRAIKKIYAQNVVINIHGIYAKSRPITSANIVQYIKSSYVNGVYPQKEYSQEFFITISTQGYQVSKQNLANLLFESTFLVEIERSSKRLNAIVEDFIEDISLHNPRILKAYEHNGKLISEQSSFLHRIVYGQHAQVSLSNMEIAEQMRPLLIKREKNYLTLTIKPEDGIVSKKITTHIACFTVKDFPVADAHQLIKIFTLNHAFAIAQTIHSAPKEAISALFEYQSKITQSIRDNDIAEKCGWNKIIADDLPITMQTNIILHSDSVEKLMVKVSELAQCLHKIGVVAILEDINLEQAFYASMPANSTFCNRFEYGTIEHAGQFLLSKSMIFEGSKDMQLIPFLPLASVHQKYYSFSPFVNKKSSHILAHGIQSEALNASINTMILHTQMNGVLCVDLNYSSIGLNKLKHGMYFKVPEVNMLNLLKFDKKGFEMFFTTLALHVCSENKIPKQERMQEDIRTFIANIQPDFTFEQLKLKAEDTIVSPTLDFALENNFLAEKDVFLFKNKFVSVHIGGLEPKLGGIFTFYTLVFNLHKAQAYDIIKIDRSFDVFNPTVILQQSITHILREYKLKLVSVIMRANIPLAFEQRQIYRYPDTFIYFDIRLFSEGTCSNYFVKTFFQLNADMAKNLMFVKVGSKKAVIQVFEASYTLNLNQSFITNELALFNAKHKNFANIIKLIENNKTPSQDVIEKYKNLI